MLDAYAFLPEELVQDILLRLPPKSLGRCSKVCKSWNRLIKSSAFIRSHTHRRNNDGADQLVLLKRVDDHHKRHYALHWDNAAFGEYAKLPNPLKLVSKHAHGYPNPDEKPIGVAVVGTCNGLVCINIITCADRTTLVWNPCIRDDRTTLIWNPCIRSFVVLPKPSVRDGVDQRDARYAFGYDSHNDDYKVLRRITTYRDGKVEMPCDVQLWSLAKSCWKSLDIHEDLGHDIREDFGPNFTASSFVNGALHWMQMCENMDHFIQSFHMSTEKFGQIQICEDLRKKEHCHDYSILRYHESLSLWDSHWGTCLNMWVMKEYGVAKSWTKLLEIRMDENVYFPLWFRKGTGEVVARTAKSVKSVDPKTEKVSDFTDDWCKTKEVTDFTSYWCNCHILYIDSFVESLVLLDQPGSISY